MLRKRKKEENLIGIKNLTTSTMLLLRPSSSHCHPWSRLLQQLGYWAPPSILLSQTLLSIQLPLKVGHVTPLLQTSPVTQSKTQRPYQGPLQPLTSSSTCSPIPASSHTGLAAVSVLCRPVPTDTHMLYSLTSFRMCRLIRKKP